MGLGPRTTVSRNHNVDLFGARNILCVRLDEIGDLVLTIPFLRELRANVPNSCIHLVVKPALLNLVELCPYVDRVLSAPKGAPGNFACLRNILSLVYFSKRTLSRTNYDLAIAPRCDLEWENEGLLTFLSGARSRVGYYKRHQAHTPSAISDGWYSHLIPRAEKGHEVTRNLRVLNWLGGRVDSTSLELWDSDQDRKWVSGILEQNRFSSAHKIIAVGIGARAPKRRWPIDRFSLLLKELSLRSGVRFLLLGSAQDKPLAERVRTNLECAAVSLAGALSLRQLYSTLKRCALFVGNDSGPKHVAAASGIPVVEISCHPTTGHPNHYNAPARFRAWGVQTVVLQPTHGFEGCKQGCESFEPHCITQISVEQVVEAVDKLL